MKSVVPLGQIRKNKAKQSFSNDREHGRLRTIFNELKQNTLKSLKNEQGGYVACRLPDAGDCLTTV